MGALEDLGNTKLMGGGNKKKSMEDILSILEILSTNVETLNQQVANGGSGGSINTKLKEFFPYISNILQYLSQEILKVQKTMNELNTTVHALEKKNSESVNGMAQIINKQNNRLDGYLNSLQPAQEQIQKTILGSNQDFANKITQMIDIHLKEITLLKKQNNAFIEKMDDLENAVRALLDKK